MRVTHCRTLLPRQPTHIDVHSSFFRTRLPPCVFHCLTCITHDGSDEQRAVPWYQGVMLSPPRSLHCLHVMRHGLPIARSRRLTCIVLHAPAPIFRRIACIPWKNRIHSHFSAHFSPAWTFYLFTSAPAPTNVSGTPKSGCQMTTACIMTSFNEALMRSTDGTHLRAYDEMRTLCIDSHEKKENMTWRKYSKRAVKSEVCRPKRPPLGKTPPGQAFFLRIFQVISAGHPIFSHSTYRFLVTPSHLSPHRSSREVVYRELFLEIRLWYQAKIVQSRA
jgi:hypothetical protein